MLRATGETRGKIKKYHPHFRTTLLSNKTFLDNYSGPVNRRQLLAISGPVSRRRVLALKGSFSTTDTFKN
jgi:hypothetical protein